MCGPGRPNRCRTDVLVNHSVTLALGVKRSLPHERGARAQMYPGASPNPGRLVPRRASQPYSCSWRRRYKLKQKVVLAFRTQVRGASLGVHSLSANLLSEIAPRGLQPRKACPDRYLPAPQSWSFTDEANGGHGVWRD